MEVSRTSVEIKRTTGAFSYSELHFKDGEFDRAKLDLSTMSAIAPLSVDIEILTIEHARELEQQIGIILEMFEGKK